MDILQSLDAILTVSLFGILAGLTLTAAAIMWTSAPKTDNLSRIADWYMGVSFMTVAVVWFLLGLVFTLVFDSVGEKYISCLSVEICDAIFTGFPLLLGIGFLYVGIGCLVSLLTGRRLRLMPRFVSKIIDPLILWILDRILPIQNGKQEN